MEKEIFKWTCKQIVPMSIYPYKNQKPKVAGDCFIAPSADVIGDVDVGQGSSVWFHATIRADLNKITIGKNTSVQDGCVLHTSQNNRIIIGDNVVIGHKAIIHSANVGDNTIIGMGAILLNAAEIGKNCIVAAGSVVTEGTQIPDNSIAMGVPAKIVKKTTDAHMERIKKNVAEYISLCSDYRKMENGVE